MVLNTMREHCIITIVYHVIENLKKYTVAYTINATYVRNIEDTTTLLYSDWLYFLWHGIR